MARINIEDDLYTSDPFLALVEKTGNRYIAIGMVVSSFTIAQRYWLEHQGIPEQKWPESLNILIDLRLAERALNSVRTPIIYVRGSKEQFSWLEQKSKAGKSKSAKKLETLKQNRTPVRSEDRTDTERAVNAAEPLTLTLTHSLPLSQSPAPAKTAAHAKKANAFIAAYCEKFKSRWGSNPEITPKRSGIAGRISKNLGEDKALVYLDAYFAMPDAWVVKAKHPLELFETKLNEITVYAQSGTFTTARQATQADSAVTVSDQIQRIREGKL